MPRRMRFPPARLAFIIAAGAGALPASFAQNIANRTDDTDAGASPALQEIVVTARKREESLQDVPLSVAAVSGQDLERRSIANLEDLGQSTPNFEFAEQPQSGRVAGIAFIRGVGQRDPISAYDPAVGIYIDGVYMGRMYANNFDMMDIERVEVLRGPQGTLFGKNTSGGAISIVSKQPDTSPDALFGRIQLTTGSRDRFDALGSVNMPLVADKLALQISGARLQQDGYGHRIDGQQMSDTDRTAGRAQLMFRAAPDFSALLSADWMEFDETNASFKLVDTNAAIGPLTALNGVIDPNYDDQWLSAGDYDFNATGPNSARGTLWGSALTLAYDASWATLKSITAYREMHVFNDLDPDGAPIEVLNKFEHAAQSQFSQEVQASGNAFNDRLAWVAGLYYFDEKIDQFEGYDLLTPLFQGARDFARVSPIENESVAVYAQGTYGITERLRLTAGLRYTQDDKTIQESQTGGSGTVPFITPVGKHSSDAVSPRLGLDYRWTPNVMTYVSVAQGAKNGGFNGRVGRLSDFIEFQDEEVWTYEVGLRSDLFDGRARLNATAYYSRYSDLQLQIAGSTVINGGPAPFSIITNVPKSRISGGELEISATPARGLTLSGGLGLTYGRYTELPTDARFVASRLITKDNELSHVPQISYTLGAEYQAPLSGATRMTGRLDYSHKSTIFFNPENTVNLRQPGYGVLGARLIFEHTPSAVAVSLFGTNLTDERYVIGGFDDAANPSPGLGFSIVTIAAPRAWGLSVQKQFSKR